MWNLVRKDRKDVLLVSCRSSEGMMRVVVFKNYEYMYAEEIKLVNINSRFQTLNEGIEIEEQSLTNHIMEALSSSDASTTFKDLHTTSTQQLELHITFNISNIQLKWLNICKLVDIKQMSEFLVQPLISYTSLLLLHNNALNAVIKEKDQIIEQYKNIQIPTLKNIKKLGQKKVEKIEDLVISKTFEESLSGDCANVFTRDTRAVMETIVNKHNLPAYFNKQPPFHDDENANNNNKNNINENNSNPNGNNKYTYTNKNEIKNSDNDNKAGKSGVKEDNTSASSSVEIGVKRKVKERNMYGDAEDAESFPEELKLQNRSLIKTKEINEKKKKIKNLKF